VCFCADFLLYLEHTASLFDLPTPGSVRRIVPSGFAQKTTKITKK
jgi:hypothetical protein